MASGRRRPSIRIIVVLLVRNVRAVSWVGIGGRGRIGWWIVDAIVDGTEDCGGLVRLAVVDCAVWVGLWRCGVDAEIRRARAERAVSEVARKARVVGRAGGGSTGVLLVKLVVVVAGPAVALEHRDGTDDSSQSTDDADDAERSSDSSFVREKALRDGASGGIGENGRSGVGGERVTAVGHR